LAAQVNRAARNLCAILSYAANYWGHPLLRLRSG
jgi:hypothetical protein